MRFVLVFFILVPLTEMLLLFEVADRVGGLLTLSLVVATAVIGVQILKRQGLATLTRANQRIQSGELPAQEIVEGMMLAGAGALLLTPGFITDTIGFVFLAGPLRRPIARRIIRSGVVKSMGAAQGGSHFSFWSSSAGRGRSRAENSNIIEGDYSKEADFLAQNRPSNEASESDNKDRFD
ncbi:MAG: FxsA family protein [Pseudohongiella sp.]|nr:FxsA family protein [Pseudohongiella sp.]